MVAAGYGPITASAENVAGGPTTANDAFSQWASSFGDQTNMLNPDIREIGLGHVYRDGSTFGHYWTLVLGSRGTAPITCADIGL